MSLVNMNRLSSDNTQLIMDSNSLIQEKIVSFIRTKRVRLIKQRSEQSVSNRNYHRAVSFSREQADEENCFIAERESRIADQTARLVEVDDKLNAQNPNELCPRIQLNKLDSNIRKKIQKSSSVKLTVNDTNEYKKKKIIKSKSNNINYMKMPNNLNININNNIYKRTNTVLKRTSSKKAVTTNLTYTIKSDETQINRQETLSSLSLSSIECDMNTMNQSHDIAAATTCNSMAMPTSQLCLSCVQPNYNKVNQYCAYCNHLANNMKSNNNINNINNNNNRSCSMPSQMSIESTINKNETNYESWVNDTNILSSTPMYPASQVKQNKTTSSNPFSLLRSCIYNNKAASAAAPAVKKQKSIKKEFKLESRETCCIITRDTLQQKPSIVAKQLKLKKNLKQSTQIQPSKRSRKHVNSARKYNLPRTSSFNSNSDDMEMGAGLDDFQCLSNNDNNIMLELVLPPKCNQNFNNFGDFVVWYV